MRIQKCYINGLKKNRESVRVDWRRSKNRQSVKNVSARKRLVATVLSARQKKYSLLTSANGTKNEIHRSKANKNAEAVKHHAY